MGPSLSQFLQAIGNDVFKQLMNLYSSKTLMFVIDDTGSMSDDINAAKDMAKEIIAYNTQNVNVDYILSPFNDPGT